MHGCQWLKLEGLLRTSPDMHLLCLFGMTHAPKQIWNQAFFTLPKKWTGKRENGPRNQ